MLLFWLIGALLIVFAWGYGLWEFAWIVQTLWIFHTIVMLAIYGEARLWSEEIQPDDASKMYRPPDNNPYIGE
jgi:hypothetical protein